MYIVLPDGQIDDPDMELLQEFLDVLDQQFARDTAKLKETHPPQQNIFWDRLSYIAGLGFVMCQQYIHVTYPSSGLDRNRALRLSPKHASGRTIVELVNAGANYWKHYLEDVDFPTGTLRKATIEPIEALGFDIESGCLCEVLLDKIVETDWRPFRRLLELLNDWRDNLIGSTNNRIGGDKE